MKDRLGRLNQGLVFTIGAAGIFYLALLPIFVQRLDPLTGDEPFYVMTAISLVRDHDLDEANNYADHDYDEFYPSDPLPKDWKGWPSFPRELPPHPAISDRPGLHTKHGLGLSFLIALPYAVGGRVGADLVVVICAALLAGQMYLLATESGADQRLAAGIALALAIAMPVGPYALLLFPEVPAALFLIFAVRRLSATSNTFGRMALTGAAIGFLPWLHQRFDPTAAVLAVIFLVRWKNVRPIWKLGAAFSPIVIGGAALIGYNEWLYGQPYQNTHDHAGFNHVAGTVNGFFGLLIDAQWGLLIAAPVLILAIGALPWWFAAARRTMLIAGVAIAPYLILVAAYKVWWGEWGPPARYLVPIVPFAAGSIAAWLSRVSPGWRVLAGGLWLVGMVLTLVGYRNPQRFYHQPNGNNNLVTRVDEITHADIAGRLVAFQPYAIAPRNEREAAAYLTIAACVLAYFVVKVLPEIFESRRRQPARVSPTVDRGR